MPDIYEVLRQLNVPYTKYDHPAVFSYEDELRLGVKVPGATSKNLFLKNKKGDKHYLVCLEIEKRADLKKLAALLNESNLSFASPERLQKYLGVTPGSVTLLGLINDINKEVVIIIDNDLWKHDEINCHPLINTASLVFKREDLKKFLDYCGNKIQFLNI
ncbi:MAG: prolyl-tRNA synthetase associated domain-containing protein [Candidatus Magasanikbacteria bacterium]|nr:prolyl-tRNA synthetase associated domain-containing protein [Candidatus Magasanikbacteria bacterium]